MLKLENIVKNYEVADTTVRALRGINLNFRKNEFVSILGPSGCGKTTLLNLIGGLDRATSGDIVINGKSTKKFTDRDWDVYRNHRIGFVFQSYNLIPHQTVLANVELALTIAGLDKATRIKRAKEALDKVGLSDQYYKRPNQLSGGQSQRVAIARALVNDPEILLADEPTGALDTVTSKQILDLIKEIASERLVIMVTHNPLLAEEYSTRIIQLLDGELIDDSNPYNQEDLETMEEANDNKKAKMSFWTAFRLSLQNLFSKMKRTIMTAIAGSIGIIGVSLVLSLSFGLQSYIDHMQEDMLSGNPIKIEQQAFDLSLMESMGRPEEIEIIKESGYVNVDKMIKKLNERLSSMDNIFVQNTITKEYVDFLDDLMITNPDDLATISYNYGLDVGNSFYTDFREGINDEPVITSLTGISATYTSVLEQIPDFADYAKIIGTLDKPFRQAISAPGYIENQYNLEYGKIATKKNEIMIVVNKDRQLTDLLLAQLGYYSQEEFINLAYDAVGDEAYDESLYDGGYFEYSKLIGKEFTWYPNNSIFTKNEGGPGKPNKDQVPFTYSPYAQSEWDPGIKLEVVGILEPKENISYGSLTSGFYYTEELALEIIKQNHLSELGVHLRDNMTSAFNGSAMFLKAGTVVNGFTIPNDMLQPISGEIITYEYNYTHEGVTKTTQGLVGTENQLFSFMGLGGSNDQDMPIIISYSSQQLGSNVEIEVIQDDDGVDLSWEVVDYNGTGFGLPNSISIYPADLKSKDNVLAYLNQWNEDKVIILSSNQVIDSTRERIVYSDILSIIMKMMSSLIQVITIALVGFTSLALIVSSVMIGIITYVSVVERIKEIGVIRSLGGRKRDVSNLFMAETFIIGLSSGILGILITYLGTLVINTIVGNLTIVKTIAIFPIYVAVIMIAISVMLTLISGLMPSKSAAKKDPVVALRTE